MIRRTMKRNRLVAAMVIFLAQTLAAADPFINVEKPWIVSNDPVALMWKRWQNGDFKPDLTSARACVASVLKELKIPTSSQTLVFSKTSLQNSLINPQTPRSVFFNEECYAGWAQGGMLEIIGMDPEKGPYFYSLTLPNGSAEKPELRTTETCLSCHQGSRTGGVKGMLVRSVFTGYEGQPMLNEGSFVSGHESPIRDRWGGWYVTGKHGAERHMGNSTAQRKGPRISFNREDGANITSLDGFFPIKPYLAPTSDIVALMVLEHQCAMHNKLTDAGKSTLEAMTLQHDLQKATKEPITDVPQGSALKVINNLAEKVVRHLLFCEEYTLTDSIEGSPAYQEAFRSNRIKTRDGRSLKDFQLRTCLFKYRCSYMIYSSSFDALPALIKNAIYQRLHDVLSGKDKSKDYEHLSESERKNILEILLETKKDLPAYWKNA
jgi:hypothetical protein